MKRRLGVGITHFDVMVIAFHCHSLIFLKHEKARSHYLQSKSVMIREIRILLWSQLSFRSHRMFEANPMHIWKLQPNANHFQQVFSAILCIIQTRPHKIIIP